MTRLMKLMKTNYLGIAAACVLEKGATQCSLIDTKSLRHTWQIPYWLDGNLLIIFVSIGSRHRQGC